MQSRLVSDNYLGRPAKIVDANHTSSAAIDPVTPGGIRRGDPSSLFGCGRNIAPDAKCSPGETEINSMELRACMRHNSRLLKDRLQLENAHAMRRKQQVALLFFDLDGFKAINIHGTQGYLNFFFL